MSLWLQTCLRRHRERRRAQGKRSALPLAVLVTLLVGAALGLHALRPVFAAYAVNAVQYAVTAAMEQAVSDTMAQHSAVAVLQTDGTGVTALTTDSAAVDEIRAQVVQTLYGKVNELEQQHQSVQLGTLIDPQFLAGIGPGIPYSIVGLGQTTAVVQSTFTDAGINQTIHKMTITVTAHTTIHLPLGNRDVRISATYPISETILVGDVPLIASNEGR